MLPAAEVERVRKAAERFRAATAAAQTQGNAGLAELVARLGGSKTGG